MGLLDFDSIVGAGISAAEDTLNGKGEEQKEKTTFFGVVLRFIISLIWFFVALAATLLAFAVTFVGEVRDQFIGDQESKIIFALGIGILLLFFLITMIIPYLRKKGSMTRFLGITALGDAIWWIYLYFTM